MRYAIAYRTIDGSIRCQYKATKRGALSRAARLVGVEVIAITECSTGRDIPITA